ncbi:hypothetical protein HKX48_009352 [Thoreauomyces humboldtii]|nr:hypothetical protein HKX48_009352 [Thoreauomyces humboldtii]
MDPHSNDLAALWPTLSEYVLGLEKEARTRRPAVGVEDLRAEIPATLPIKGKGVLAALELFQRAIAPVLSNCGGPRYFGFIIGGVTPAAHLGDVLATSFDQNVMTASASAGSAAANVEEATLNMIVNLLDLPGEFTGLLTSGGTGSNTLALAIARQWIGAKHGVDIAEDGLQSLGARRIRILATQPHQSINKGLATLGLGRATQAVPGILGSPTQMDPQALEVALCASAADESSTAGCIVVVQSGDVNSGTCDLLPALAAVCQRHGAWLHVDGAASLLARASPTYAHQLAGLELADSITGDCHKWFNVPYDCGVLLTRHRDLHAKTMTAAAAYLSAPPPSASGRPAFAPIDLAVENSRRFRALPLWMALQAYGRDGFAAIVDRTCAFAKAVGSWIEEDDVAKTRFELLLPVVTNAVLFRVRPRPDVSLDVDSVRAKAVLAAANDLGKVFMTGTVWEGRPAIRIAVANWRTTVEDDMGLLKEALLVGYTTAEASTS